MYKNICLSFRLVFSKKFYIFLALIITILFFIGGVILTTVHFLKLFFSYTQPDFYIRSGVISKTWNFFGENSTVWSKYLLVIVSVLSGINISMFLFYLKRRIKLERSLGTGFFGTIVGLLGIGCASCGSIFLSSIFGYAAVTSFLGILPFQGQEIGVVGILLLLISIYLIANKIQNPNSCKISNN